MQNASAEKVVKKCLNISSFSTRGFIDVFSRRAAVFYQVGKIFTVSEFAQHPALNETLEVLTGHCSCVAKSKVGVPLFLKGNVL